MSAQNCRRSERLKQQLARGYIERASKLLTELAYQRAPRGVLMPRAFSASAIWWSDVALAFVDRNREIVELPAGLENGQTRKRLRGARTDSDCIDEICEIVAQGITATAIFIDKCEHVSLLASKLSTCKANKLFRSQFCIVTHLTKTPRVESRSELSVLPVLRTSTTMALDALDR